jgi:hypothetical protein
MEAHIEALTRQNAELLLRNMEQPHPEVNWDGHEEEECNNRINFREGDTWELRNRRPHRPGG